MKKIIPLITACSLAIACTDNLKENNIVDENDNIVLETEIFEGFELDSDSVALLCPHEYPEISCKKSLERNPKP